MRLESLEDRRLLSTATTTVVEAVRGTTEYGQPAAIVAQVTTSPASSRGSGPTGTVDFFLNSPTGTPLGSATVNQRGTAVLSTESSPLPVGSADTIYAVYSGDSNFGGSQASTTATVDPAATHTTVYASPNPGVAGGNVTFTAIVSGAAPHGDDNGGQTAPPTGTVTFTVNGTAVPATSVTFVGDSGNDAIYTFTTSTSSLTGTPNTVTASYAGDSNYLASSSRTLNYQVVSAAGAGTGTITAGSSASPLTLRGGQTFSINYSNTSSGSTTVAPGNTVTYVDSAKGVNLAGTITSVVFSSNGKQAEISGTGTNTDGSTTTPVNFTMEVSTGGGWFDKSSVGISIVGSTAVSGATGTGFLYNNAGALASGSAVTINETGSTAKLPADGGLPGAHDEVLKRWTRDGGGGFGGWRRAWPF